MDYPNILQIIGKIKKQKEFNELTFLISIAAIALTISKIIIFVHSLNREIILVIYLQNLFFGYI